MSERSEQFQRRVHELVTRFETELDRDEWVTRRYPKRLRDESREIYEVTALYLQKGPTKLLLDPVGYDIPGAELAADIYQMPAYDPMAYIYFESGRWVLYYTFPADILSSREVIENQALPMTAETINQVLDSIAEHAVPAF